MADCCDQIRKELAALKDEVAKKNDKKPQNSSDLEKRVAKLEQYCESIENALKLFGKEFKDLFNGLGVLVEMLEKFLNG